MAIELRDYQLEAVEKLRDAIRRGKKNILLCAPTGAGKTIVSAFLIQESYNKYKKSAFVCDRLALIDQTSSVFFNHKIPHGVIQSNHPLWYPYERVQVCSAQTLARRQFPNVDLIVVDECHTLHKVVIRKLKERDTVAIGLTATPFTRGLGRYYDELVNVTTTNELIGKGFLSDFRIFAPSQPDMTGVKVVNGEWEEKETSKRAMAIVGDCVAEYIKHGENRKFICSGVDTAHVAELERQFSEAGISVASYTYKTREDERRDLVEEFRKPDSYIRGLITVSAITKGFDVPDVGVIIMARPLRSSLSEHIQFFGRGLRACEGKRDCVILDHAGNCQRFGADTEDFFQFGATELDDGKEKKNAKKKVKEDKFVTCPQCKRLHKAAPMCPECGHEYPLRLSVVHDNGILVETKNSEKIPSLLPQLCRYVIDKKGLTDAAQREMQALYKNITGSFANKTIFNTVPADFVSKEVKNKIMQTRIAYWKRRAA